MVNLTKDYPFFGVAFTFCCFSLVEWPPFDLEGHMAVLFPKGEFLEELFEWVLLFLSRFYLFYCLEILRPYALYLYCGGWVVVVVVGRILAYATFESCLLLNFLWELKTTSFLNPIASYQLKIWMEIKFFRISVKTARIILNRKK